ncbi:Transposase domain [Halorientalis persicus]|uniref:Transposase domain n=1 Tax=Halorientalis persicus TaxID=1367881 RepID=A0A1H8WF28_9EURY|nr:transposase [Halorientalis persicus]SEP26241.1 Transposase domain [Halorientalis persicus]
MTEEDDGDGGTKIEPVALTHILADLMQEHYPQDGSLSPEELDNRRSVGGLLGELHKIQFAIRDDEVMNFLDDLSFDGSILFYLDGATDGQVQEQTERIEEFPDFWESLSEKEKKVCRVVVLQKAHDVSFRGIARHLSDRPEIVEEIGFEDGLPHHSTLSRHRDFDDEEEKILDDIAQHARHGAIRTGRPIPPTLVDEYGVGSVDTAEISTDEKMALAEDRVRSLFDDLLPHIGFDRDPSAANYQVPTTGFYALLAHLALEQTYAETGVRTFRWMDPQPTIPEAKTLFRYIREYSVEEIDEKFAAATEAFLARTSPPSPVHLAYDLTDVRWYGDDTNRWPSGTYPKDNSSSAWQFAILSAVGDDYRYILGALPLREESHLSGYLRRFLRRAINRFKLEIGRVYLDSQMYQEDVVDALRAVGVDYLIQAKDTGAISDLLDRAPPDESATETQISFKDYPSARRPNAFAYPIPPEEVGGRNQKRDHTAFLTDMDVHSRDLRGLSYQFRSRWNIETSIRELKNRFHGRLQASDGEVRAWFFCTAALFYNIYTYLNSTPVILSRDDVRLTGAEVLHVLRETTYSDYPEP